MSTVGRTKVGGVFAVLLALAAQGCGVSAPAVGSAGPVRALSIPGDSLYAWASNPAKWSAPHDAERKCTGNFWCGFFGAKKVKIDIYADVNAKNFGPNPPNASGTLIGKFINKGNATEAMYGLTPGPYQFLLYVFPAGGVSGRWVIERVDNAPPHNHVTIAQGSQVGCNHDRTWPNSFAEFRSCADSAPPPRSSLRSGARTPLNVRTAGFSGLSIFKAINMKNMTGEDPAWFTCTSGCCVADAPQLF